MRYSLALLAILVSTSAVAGPFYPSYDMTGNYRDVALPRYVGEAAPPIIFRRNATPAIIFRRNYTGEAEPAIIFKRNVVIECEHRRCADE